MDCLTIGLVVAGLALIAYYFGTRGLDYFEKHGIPHIKPLPFFGNMAPVVLRRKAMAHLIQDVYDLNPEAKYVGFYDFLNPVIVVRDPELIKVVAVKSFEHFLDHRSFVNETVDPLFGKNLFSLQGEKWKDMRNLLSPAFTSSKMKGMFKLMNKCAEDFASFLAEDTKLKSKAMEMKDIFTRYTTDVIATCAFGITVDSMRDPTNRFYVLGKKMTIFDGWRTVKFFFVRSFPTVSKLLDLKLVEHDSASFFTNVVKDTIGQRDEKNISRPDMLQLMMDSRGKRGDKSELTIQDMVAQAFIFFFGGFDTTSSLMSFAAHEIGVNDEVQDKLRDEIRRVLESTNNEPGYEDINNMEYLDAVINEALRMYPIAVFLDRLCFDEFELPPTLPGHRPVKIKKDATIWFPAYGLHMDPNYWDSPNKFIPERFMGDKKDGVHNPGYIPFGMGPRMCIGNRFALLETKVLLFHVISKCSIKPSEKTKIPLVLNRNGLSMLAEDGFWLKVSPVSESNKNGKPVSA